MPHEQVAPSKFILSVLDSLHFSLDFLSKFARAQISATLIKLQREPRHDHFVITTTVFWPGKLPIHFLIKNPVNVTKDHFFNFQRAYFFVFNLVNTTTNKLRQVAIEKLSSYK